MMRERVIAGILAGLALSGVGATTAVAEPTTVTGYPSPSEMVEPDQNRPVTLTVTIPEIDEEGNGNQGYVVSLNNAEGIFRESVSDDNGDAVFNNLAQGQWTVSVTAPEHENLEFQDITVQLPFVGQDENWWYEPSMIMKPRYADDDLTDSAPITSTSVPVVPTKDYVPPTKDVPVPDQGKTAPEQIAASPDTTPAESGRESLPVTGVEIGAIIALIVVLSTGGLWMIFSRKKTSSDATE